MCSLQQDHVSMTIWRSVMEPGATARLKESFVDPLFHQFCTRAEETCGFNLLPTPQRQTRVSALHTLRMKVNK